jgi:pyruvate/2-oxoacid:ferredoxin oxidoreductase alpha subunit
MERRRVTIDGNEAAASVAHRTNEVIAIYPITAPLNRQLRVVRAQRGVCEKKR